MEELLRFEHVSFAYEDGAERRLALRDCSVSIGAGERIAVLGSNGAGKSTFFLLANGVLCPKEGTVFFHGEPVGRKKQELNRLRRGVGLVFQDPAAGGNLFGHGFISCLPFGAAHAVPGGQGNGHSAPAPHHGRL